MNVGFQLSEVENKQREAGELASMQEDDEMSESDVATVMYGLTLSTIKRGRIYGGRKNLISLAQKTRFLKELEDDRVLNLFWRYMRYAKRADSVMEIVALRRLLQRIIEKERGLSTFEADLAKAAIGYVF